MYTQCPECSTAFRVTADVLKQAAGRVRCGGCGSAFNALSYLSESLPEQTAPKEVDAALPELKPETPAGDGPPKKISASQSAALLKTLDEISGPDARLEDTGVEWRILDENEIGDAAADEEAGIDEVSEAAPATVDELRFDDNTPLPDDYDVGGDGPAPVDSAAAKNAGTEAEEFVDRHPQADLDLTEPDEWTDILGEFEDLAEVVAADSAIEPEDPTREDDHGEPLDMDSQFALQAEAMGIELSGMREALEAGTDAPVDDEIDLERLVRESKSETAELGDLLDEGHVDEFEDEPEEVAGLDEIPDETDEQPIPPMTEEEKTINMQIDQDLLALAVENEDGVATAMATPESGSESETGESEEDEQEHGEDAADKAPKASGAGFETIIMEGEAFRSPDDLEKLEADAAEAALLIGKAAVEKEPEEESRSRGVGYAMIAGIVVLLLLLAAQFVHQSRETLATIPAFNQSVGAIYRAIGQPLSPAWNIKGWRFEVARGTEEGDDSLTVYSRLGNKSDGPLPYPLIGISLTDRFEETIGSRVLDPVDYLSRELDPSELVQAGNTFEAVITIRSLAETTAGFRLRACYRTGDGHLRCKDDGFK